MFITLTIHFLDVSTNFSDSFHRCSTVEARGRNTSLRQQPIRREATAFPDARKPIDERIADEARFFKAWFENPLITGAVSPSGRYLARMMARYVDPASSGPIVELGPGTGPVTQALLHRGVDPERLVLIEYDAAFCKLLERRFPECRVVQGDAYNLSRTLDGVLDGAAAAVVSSLPLLNKPDSERLSLLDQAFGLMQPDGCFIQFTYGMVSPIPRRAKMPAGPAFDSEPSPPVWLNLPPARVWVYRRSSDAHPAKKRAGEALIIKLRARRDKVRDEFRETAERVESQFKARTARARLEIELRASKVREDKAIKPALELIRRIGEPKKRRGH